MPKLILWKNHGIWGVKVLTDACVFNLRGWSINNKGV